ARYDGSSRFAPGNRWGFFPGVSAGWRLDKEAFMQDSFFDFFKLRASVGALGNQAVALYSYEQSIVLGQDYSFGGALISGAAANAYSDPNISWETTTSYNVGLDLGIFDNKLSFTDRKSTRLNSSHVKISYAVFCLKKKKTQTITLGVKGGDDCAPKEWSEASIGMGD